MHNLQDEIHGRTDDKAIPMNSEKFCNTPSCLLLDFPQLHFEEGNPAGELRLLPTPYSGHSKWPD